MEPCPSPPFCPTSSLLELLQFHRCIKQVQINFHKCTVESNWTTRARIFPPKNRADRDNFTTWTLHPSLIPRLPSPIHLPDLFRAVLFPRSPSLHCLDPTASTRLIRSKPSRTRTMRRTSAAASSSSSTSAPTRNRVRTHLGICKTLASRPCPSFALLPWASLPPQQSQSISRHRARKEGDKGEEKQKAAGHRSERKIASSKAREQEVYTKEAFLPSEAGKPSQTIGLSLSLLLRSATLPSSSSSSSPSLCSTRSTSSRAHHSFFSSIDSPLALNSFVFSSSSSSSSASLSPVPV